MNKAIIQFQLAQNKVAIQNLEDDIASWKRFKTQSDDVGDLMSEYDAHNKLKVLRKELKKYVSAQKFFKQIIKEI